MDYRQRLFQHYVTTHFAALREISIDACERHRTTFRAYFQHLLPEDKGAKILDIGCGYGPFLYFLQKEGYRNICGVDISPEQVEAARQLGIDNVYCDDLIPFLHGTLRHLPVSRLSMWLSTSQSAKCLSC